MYYGFHGRNTPEKENTETSRPAYFMFKGECMDIEAMAREFLTITDEAERMDIAANIYRDLKKPLQCICSKFSLFEDPEDLLQECFFALYDALSTYDPIRGNIKTHIYNYAYWHIYRYIDQTPQHKGIMQEARKIQKYVDTFRAETGQEPTDMQTARHFRTDPDNIIFIKERANSIKYAVSLDETPPGAEGCIYAEIIPDDKQNPEEEAIKAYTCQQIQNAVCRLPEDERRLIENYLQGNTIIPAETKARSKALSTQQRAFRRLQQDKVIRSLAREEGLLCQAYKWHYHGTSHTEYAALELASIG